jgi:hypothetical protein
MQNRQKTGEGKQAWKAVEAMHIRFLAWLLEGIAKSFDFAII